MLHGLKYFFEFNKSDDTIRNAVDVDKFIGKYLHAMKEVNNKLVINFSEGDFDFNPAFGAKDMDPLVRCQLPRAGKG